MPYSWRDKSDQYKNYIFFKKQMIWTRTKLYANMWKLLKIAIKVENKISKPMRNNEWRQFEMIGLGIDRASVSLSPAPSLSLLICTPISARSLAVFLLRLCLCTCCSPCMECPSYLCASEKVLLFRQDWLLLGACLFFAPLACFSCLLIQHVLHSCCCSCRYMLGVYSNDRVLTTNSGLDKWGLFFS